MDNSASSRNVLIFGATGSIGKPIMAVLVEHRSSFKRLVVFTSPGGGEKKMTYLALLKEHGVEVIEGDLRDENQVLYAYQGVDTVVCALGRGAIDSQINLIQWADQSPSIRRFIPSEFGTDIEHSPSSACEKPHQQKLKVRACMAKVKKLDWTYIVTGPYAEAEPPMFFSALIQDPDMGSFDVKKRHAILVGDGTSPISFTTTRDVGKQLYQVLLHPKESRRKALKLRSFTATPNDILKEFERQTHSNWTVSYIPIDEYGKREAEAWDSKAPMAPIYTLRRIWTEGGTLYSQYDNDLIGAVDMDTLTDAVKIAIEKQESDDGIVDENKQFQ